MSITSNSIKVIVLLTVLFYSSAKSQDTTFYWAAEPSGECSRANVTKSTGLCGSLHFNQHDSWPFVSGRPQGFFNWETNYTFPSVWCMEGTIASLMIYFSWPERSCFNGLFDTADIKSIDHFWSFNDLKNSDWRYGIPVQEYLSSYPVGSQLAKKSNEVGRLFYAAHIGLNHDTAGYHDYAPAFGQEVGATQMYNQRFLHTLKNRFGYLNANCLNTATGGYEATIDTIQKYISLQQPIFAYVAINNGNRHAWLFDAFEPRPAIYSNWIIDYYKSATRCESCTQWARYTITEPNGIVHLFCYTHISPYMDKVHCTDMGTRHCGSVPAAWWFESPWLTFGDRASYSPGFIIYNLDPTITIPNSTNKTYSFRFGRPYISNTDNCTRKGRFRIKNFGSATGAGFYVSVKSQHWSSSQWQDDPNALVSRTLYSFSGNSSEISLPQFSYSVKSKDSITITLLIENSSGSEFRARTILDDCETGLMFSQGGEGKLFVDGLGNSSLKSVWGPIGGAGSLRFIKDGEEWNVQTINNDRTLSHARIIPISCPVSNPDSGYIGTEGMLTFRNETGKVLLGVDSRSGICCFTTNRNKYLGDPWQ